MCKASPALFFPLALAFVVTHYLALQFHLYWYISWFDIVMHVWGGFLVVCALLMFSYVSKGRVRFNAPVVATVLVCTMVAWEILEYSLGLTGTQPDFVVDTSMDLLCGAIGGLLGYLAIKK